MKKIIAIGGGEIGKPGFPIETAFIDKEIIRLTNKKSPVLLFIPTASGDAEGYSDTVRNYFGKKLGCKVEVLNLLKEKNTLKQIKDRVFSADIVYVGGGNTLKLMKAWRRFGVDDVLKQAYKKGIVMSGISAGAICWFRYGNSETRKIKKPGIPLTRVSGMNIFPTLLCPHYDFQKDRRPDLKRMMKRSPGVAIAIDDCCAIEIMDETYRIISSKDSANAYKVFWSKGKFNELVIKKEKNFLPISEILRK